MPLYLWVTVGRPPGMGTKGQGTMVHRGIMGTMLTLPWTQCAGHRHSPAQWHTYRHRARTCPGKYRTLGAAA